MKRVLGAAGVVVFWLAWPFWIVYFKLHFVRSRVVLVCDDEVLLVRGVINRDDRWSLPGGGCHKNETSEAGAVREVREETGITLDLQSLGPLGEHIIHSTPGVKYKGVYFVSHIGKKPELQLQKHEILDAVWFPVKDLKKEMLQDDAVHGLAQAGLLPL